MAQLTAQGLTDRIEQEFADVYARAKGASLPGTGGDDRRMLFAAVAGGVLAYLKANEDAVIDSLTVQEAGLDKKTLSVVEASLDIGS
jgi:hypothetical protein